MKLQITAVSTVGEINNTSLDNSSPITAKNFVAEVVEELLLDDTTPIATIVITIQGHLRD